MSDIEQEKITNLSNNWRALAFLSANYQGRFAALNILGQLASVDYKKTELVQTKELLQKLVELITITKNGRSIFFPSAEEEQELSEEEIKNKQELLVEISAQLKSDLNERADKTQNYLAAVATPDSMREAHFLLSSFGWYAYSRDNYMRSMIEIGEFLNNNMMIETFNFMKTEAAEEIRLTNDFLKNLKKNNALNKTFFEHLWFFCRILPGVFRANAHDINLLLSFTEPSFTFSDAGFSPEEEEVWTAAGFDPEGAGYWKAYDLKPEAALVWLQAGISDPKAAAEWGTAGFAAEVSAQWIRVQFNPLLAIQWYNAGYQAEQAAFLVSKGIHHPAQIRQDQIPALVKEFEEIQKKRVRSEEEAWFGNNEEEDEEENKS